MKPKTSPVWGHFELVSDTKIECNHCKTILSRSSQGGTSNMRKHLKCKHPTLQIDDPINIPKDTENKDKGAKKSTEFDKWEDEESSHDSLTSDSAEDSEDFSRKGGSNRSPGKISSIYDGEYFEIVQQKDDTLLVRCNTCGPEALQLKASLKSNGNILKHIQRRHPELLSTIKIQKNIKSRNKSDQMIFKKPRTSMQKTVGSSHASKSMVFIEATSGDSMEKVYHFAPTDVSNEESVVAADSLTELKFRINEQNIEEISRQEEIEASNFITRTSERQQQQLLQQQSHNANQQHQIHTSTTHHLQVDSHPIIIQTPKSLDPLENDSSNFINKSSTTQQLVEEFTEEETAFEELEEDHLSFEYENISNSNRYARTNNKKSNNFNNINEDKELARLRKDLLIREFEEIQEMRREKHRFEIEILRRELEFKKIEHRKKIEFLDKKIREKSS